MKHQSVMRYEYHVWANKKFFDHLKELPGDIYDKEVQSVFPSISEVFAHMYVVDNLWLGGLTQTSFDELKASIGRWQEESNGKSIEEMEKLFNGLSEKYQAFFRRQPNLDEVTTIHHPNFGTLETPFSEIVQHIVNHGTYHRGNITAMLRQLGHPGVPTDYVFYLYEQQPAE